MPPETIKIMNSLLEAHNFKSNSEFIYKAVDFYIGHLNANDSTSYLADCLYVMLTGIVGVTENRIANSMFRLTVEMCMMMNVIAEGLKINEDYLDKLRQKSIKYLKQSRGKIDLADFAKEEFSKDL